MKKLIFSLSIFCFGQMFSTCYLDELAIKYGTDKSSKWHNYTPIYDKYFNNIKSEPINFLEIGLEKCCSALMWEEYFQNANLYFIDISAESIKRGESILSKRSKCYLIDQGNKIELNNFIKETENVKFDIIIDDGGHTSNQQITSFIELFPYVKKGGVYIIEDLHCSYMQYYGGYGEMGAPKAGPGTAIRFLQDLVDEMNYAGAYMGVANRNMCSNDLKRQLNYYQENIEALHFYSSMCFIFKR